jgi:hypothetical protein
MGDRQQVFKIRRLVRKIRHHELRGNMDKVKALNDKFLELVKKVEKGHNNNENS